jgi:hypothetical protein
MENITFKIYPEQDDYFNVGLKYFIDHCKPVLPAPAQYCHFVKLDIHSLTHLLNGSGEYRVALGNVVLVSSTRCMPLARFIERVNNGRVYVLDISCTGRHGFQEEVNRFNAYQMKQTITLSEYRALRLSLQCDSIKSLDKTKRKTYYSQRANALRKLKVKTTASLLIWQDNYT